MRFERYRRMAAETVARPMLDGIEKYGAEGYTREDVRDCEEAIYAYLDALAAISVPTDAIIMAQVKALVLKLNELNEAADYALIETDAREAIWEIIQRSAVDCGLKNASDDITEQWRDW